MSYKNLFKIMIFCSIFFVFANGDENPSCAVFFSQANELYKQGKYSEALMLYKKIPDYSPTVFYNMGNCAYKLNNFGYALAYWRKAEHNWGLMDGSDLLDNIKILKNRLYDSKKGLVENHENQQFLQKVKNIKMTFDFFIHSIPLIYFQIAFLLIWILAFVFIRYLFKTKQKLLIVMLFTMVAISGLILVLKYNFENKQYGVVVSKSANLLSGPGQTYQVVGCVPEASELLIEKSVDDFFKVKINGQFGWISKSSVEKI